MVQSCSTIVSMFIIPQLATSASPSLTSLLTNRWRVRTTVPQIKRQLVPTWPYLVQFRSANAQQKAKQKENSDNHYRVREPTDLRDDINVWVRTDGQTIEDRVVGPEGTPRNNSSSGNHSLSTSTKITTYANLSQN